MKFHKNLRKLTRDNEAYRRVLVTGKHSQLVLMALEKGDAIGASSPGAMPNISAAPRS